MTTMTIAPGITGDDAFTDGQIDAHDEHHNGTPLHVIESRATWYVQHGDTLYAAGYAAAWVDLTNQQHGRLAVDTAWAYLERAEATR